jgi:hypothetical protein
VKFGGEVTVSDADVQPCLIVNDLKLGETHGQVALWTGSNTEAYFSNLTVGSRGTPNITEYSK